MRTHKFRKGLKGGYVYSIYYQNGAFVSKEFNTPLEVLQSLKRNLDQHENKAENNEKGA